MKNLLVWAIIIIVLTTTIIVETRFLLLKLKEQNMERFGADLKEPSKEIVRKLSRSENIRMSDKDLKRRPRSRGRSMGRLMGKIEKKYDKAALIEGIRFE